MGSIARAASGIAAAMLIGTAAAAASPSTAAARQAVYVPCSTSALLNAVTAANAVGSGTLVLAPYCTYNLTAPSATGTRGDDGLPIITSNLHLIGERATTIQRTSGTFRLIEVAAGAQVTITNITLSSGNAGPNPGGSILNARGTLLLDHVTLADNRADSGAGVANDSGRVTLWYTLVSGNISTAGGGGAYNDGTLTSLYSRFTTNHAGTSGGAVYSEVGEFNATRTTLDRNSAALNGGGLENAAGGAATLTSTLVALNSATNGGGIYTAAGPGPVQLANSEVTRNSPNNCAPAGFVPGCVG